jgi:hypothetical protein
MDICSCGLLPNPAKVPNFQYRAWLCSMVQKFYGDEENTWESRFWDLAQWPKAKIRPKSQNSNTRHDGILSTGNFMLMLNNHFAWFQLPGNLLKNCAPYFRGNTQFPIYWNFTGKTVNPFTDHDVMAECNKLNFSQNSSPRGNMIWNQEPRNFQLLAKTVFSLIWKAIWSLQQFQPSVN